jgi:hypothetical protein
MLNRSTLILNRSMLILKGLFIGVKARISIRVTLGVLGLIILFIAAF